MKSLVFFPGKACLDESGAVRVVAANLFPGPVSNIKGSIIGMRHFIDPKLASPALTQIDLLPQYLRRSIFYRAVSKACRTTFPSHPVSLSMQLWVQDKLSIIADNLAAKHVRTVFKRNPDADIAMGFSSMSLAFGRAAKAAGKRYAIHCQWCHPRVQNALVAAGYRTLGLAPPFVPRSRVRRQIAEFELADIIWCPSKFVQQSLVENGVPQEKTFVAYLGIDVNRFKVPEGTQRSNGHFQILFVGNICIQKGIHVLLESLLKADLPPTELVLNGQADTITKRILSEYRPRLAEKKISVRIDPGDPRRYHKTASVFVLPSLHDAYGISLPEAMAAGLPIIVSDHAGAHEIVHHGKNSFVFKSANVDQLAERFSYFSANHSAQVTFANASRESAAQYDVKSTSSILFTAMEKLCTLQ